MTLTGADAAEEFRLALRGLAALAVVLGLGLWGVAAVYHRRGLRRDVPLLLAGGALALVGGGALLWALP